MSHDFVLGVLVGVLFVLLVSTTLYLYIREKDDA